MSESVIVHCLKQLDAEHNHLLNLASALAKKGLSEHANNLVQYADGISHAIAEIQKYIEGEEQR